MNHIYHSIWNEALGAWIAVSEIAKGQGKRSANCRKLPASQQTECNSFSYCSSVGWVAALSQPNKCQNVGLPKKRQPKLHSWSQRTCFLIPDSKTAKAALLPSLILFSASVSALPTGNELVAGQATVSNPAVNQMQINQASDRAVINWQGFSVGQNEAVNIQQPNAQAALLNRVVGQDASQIQGKIQANGQVYLVNPNGVMFSKTAQVDVGGLIATTHDISNADFMNGKNHFTQNGATGKVENHGTINTSDGGVVALIGEQVTNTGTINTPKGTTALAAGKTVDLDFKGDGLVEVKVSEAALNAQINNQGAITADGGRVVITAKAANSLMDTVINQNGIVKAQGLAQRNGEIILDGGDNGAVKVSGTLDAGSTNLGLYSETGGNIKVTGKNVQINAGATVTASGETGGGNIVIGDKQTTSQTTIQESATVSAQAKTSGTAGNIAVLANMDSGTVNVAGKLDASVPTKGNGGHIDTSAAKVKIADSAKISSKANNGNNGTWLIDPNDFTIAATGGITATALSNALNNNDVKIQTGATTANCTGATCATGSTGNGDIFVNEAVAWSANKLTLSAFRNININAALNGSVAAKLALEVGQGALAAGNTSDYNVKAAVNLPAGVGNFSTKLGSDGAVKSYTVITDLGAEGSTTAKDLQGMNGGLATNYALGANIDASPTSTWAGGFMSVGTEPWAGTAFTGDFAGLGHTVTGLTINRPATHYVGLFGGTSGATVRDIGMVGGSVTGNWIVGGLAGWSDSSKFNNAYATGSVTGNYFVGGLVGKLVSGTLNNAYATGSVTGNSIVGGLVAYSYGDISNSYATGSVSGISGGYVGGLVGDSYCRISNSYATGSVNGSGDYIGGLIGRSKGDITNGAQIAYSYATGSVNSSGNYVGGLVGAFISKGGIQYSYATGSVSGANYVGGLVGQLSSSTLYPDAFLSDVYATGNVHGTSIVGGLVGYSKFTNQINTFATGSVTGTSVVSRLVGKDYGSGIVGWIASQTGGVVVVASCTGCTSNVSHKSTAELQQMATFSNSGWDITNTGGSNAVWRIYDGYTYPLLRSFLAPLTVTAANQTSTYNGLAYSGGLSATYSISGAASSGHLLTTPTPYSNAVNAGTYNPILYSDQQGYDISQINGTLTINPATLTYTADAASRLFGAANPAFTGTVTGFVNGENINTATTGTLNFSSLANALSNVGSYAITGAGLTANNGNYNFVQALSNATALTVTPTPPEVVPIASVIPVIPATPVIPESLPEKINVFVPPTAFHVAPFVFTPHFDEQLAPLETSTTGIGRAHQLRWVYKHWRHDTFARVVYDWLLTDIKQHIVALLANKDVEIVNEGMKLPK